jgi:hypothetical protein
MHGGDEDRTDNDDYKQASTEKRTTEDIGLTILF